jgi:hypothetical protein
LITNVCTYDKIGENLLQDKEVVKAIVSVDPKSFKQVKDEFKKDNEIALIAVSGETFDGKHFKDI